MKRGFVISTWSVIFLSLIGAAQSRPTESTKIVDGYTKLPLAFELNQGQTDPQVKFLSKGQGYSLFLTVDAAILALQPSTSSSMARRAETGNSQAARAVLRMELLNTNPNAELSAQDQLPGASNYFIGTDPAKWHTNVPQFSKVRYRNIYPHIDLLYYGHQTEMEYDFVLQRQRTCGSLQTLSQRCMPSIACQARDSFRSIQTVSD
jgi:hypothetical protein